MTNLVSKIRILCVTTFFVLPWCCGQQFATAADCVNDQDHFNFLLGRWRVVETKTPSETWQGGDDRYHFEASPSGLISSFWYFNRGTKTNPNYTYGRYFSAFDSLSCRWNFYYVSANASMYFDGQRHGAGWQFLKRFELAENSFLQRQFWTPVGQDQLLRVIENSNDDGESWIRGYEILLERY